MEFLLHHILNGVFSIVQGKTRLEQCVICGEVFRVGGDHCNQKNHYHSEYFEDQKEHMHHIFTICHDCCIKGSPAFNQNEELDEKFKPHKSDVCVKCTNFKKCSSSYAKAVVFNQKFLEFYNPMLSTSISQGLSAISNLSNNESQE